MRVRVWGDFGGLQWEDLKADEGSARGCGLSYGKALKLPCSLSLFHELQV